MIDGERTEGRVLVSDASVEPTVDKQFWCSSDVESFRGFEYYRDGICRSFMDLIPEPEAHNEWNFFGSVETMAMGVGRLNRVVATSHLVRRTKAEIANSNEECFYLNYKTRGECQIHQSGQISTLLPGEVGIFDSSIPFDLEHRRCPDLAVSSFMLPRQAIKDRLQGDLPCKPMILSRHPKLGALIRETSSTLSQEADRLSVAERERMYDMLLDLVAMALTSSEEAVSLPRASRANALLLSAKNYVDQNRFRGDLSAAVVANALGISVRYLHKIFSGTEMSFAEYGLMRRLEAAASALATPAFSHRSISEISRQCAFSDPAYFHRVFKKRFGCTPGEWRSNQGD